MMVLPDTPAAKSGLINNDLILRINGQEVNSSYELMSAVDQSYFLVLIEGKRGQEDLSLILNKGKQEAGSGAEPTEIQGRLTRNNPLLHRIAALGLIPVPPPESPVYLETRKPDLLGWLKNIFARFKR